MHKYSFIIIHLKTMDYLVKIQDKNKPHFVEYIWTLLQYKMNDIKNYEHK